MMIAKSLRWMSVSLMIFSVAGCVTTEEGGPSISGIFGPEESGLPLTPAEQQLREDRRIFNETVVGGALIHGPLWAVICGATTLLAGGSKHALRNMAVCGVMGLAYGALDGYRVAKKQELARRQIREIQLLTEDVEAENRRIEQSIENVDVVIANTRQSLREARAGYRNQTVSLEELRARERHAQHNVKEIDELIENMEERNEQYQNVAKELRAEGENTSEIDQKIEETQIVLAEKKRERNLLAEELEQGRIG